MAFAACGAIWGSTFLVISIGNDALAPVWAATLRLALAALLLAAWTRARGRALPRGAALRAALGYGVAQFGVNLPLLYWGEKMVPSGLVGRRLRDHPALERAHDARARDRAAHAGQGAGRRRRVRGRRGAVLVDAARRTPRPSAWRRSSSARRPPASGTVLLKRGPRQDPFGANAVGCAIGAADCRRRSASRSASPTRSPRRCGAAWPLLYLTVAGSLGAYVHHVLAA